MLKSLNHAVCHFMAEEDCRMDLKYPLHTLYELAIMDPITLAGAPAVTIAT